MIAAALVPPLGVVGIGVAWASPGMALAAGVLVLVNILAINLTSLAVLWYKGYRPENWFGEDEARVATKRRAVAFILAILVLSSFLGAVSYDTYRTGMYQEQVNDDVTAVLESPEYDQLELVDVTVEYTDPAPVRQPDHVVVTVGHPVGTDPPPVAETLQQRESVRTGPAIHLPTGPLIEFERADVVVRYSEQDQ